MARKAAPKTTKMYWPHSSGNETGEKRVFGHPAELNEKNHLVVTVPNESVKNEKLRGRPLLTKKQYDALFVEDDDE